MKNEHLYIKEFIFDYLNSDLSETESENVRRHLSDCLECRCRYGQYQILNELFLKENEIEPSNDLRNNFYRRLKEEKRTHKKNSTRKSFRFIPNPLPALRYVAAVVLLIIAYELGRLVEQQDVNQVSNYAGGEMLSGKEIVMLSLITDESASKRIKGVHHLQEMPVPVAPVIEAIIDRMKYDENVNVRLAAVRALERITPLEVVKNAYIDSLGKEDHSSVQIEIIGILAKNKVQEAIGTIRKLYKEEKTEPFVKGQIAILLPMLT